MNLRLVLSLVLVVIFTGAGAFWFFSRQRDTLPPPPENVVLPTVTVTEPSLAEAIEKAEQVRVTEQKLQAEDTEKLQQAMSQGEKSLCDTISTTTIRDDCIAKLTINTVIKSGDISLCTSLSGSHLSTCEDEAHLSLSVGAVQTGSLSERKKGCDKIQNEQRKSECISAIEEQELAERSSNPAGVTMKFCDSLSDSDTSTECQSIVEEKVDYTTLSEAVRTNNADTCGDISESNLAGRCRDNIYYTEAKNTRTIAPCASISDEELENRCVDEISRLQDLENYKAARSETSIDACEAIQEDELRTRCTEETRYQIAINTKNTALCVGLINEAQCRESITLLTSQ